MGKITSLFANFVGAAATTALLIGCAVAPGATERTNCQRLGALGGAALAGLSVVTAAYISDSNVDILHKIQKGEPLGEALSHHVNTTDKVMLYGGLFAVASGAIAGTVAAHYYCAGPNDLRAYAASPPPQTTAVSPPSTQAIQPNPVPRDVGNQQLKGESPRVEPFHQPVRGSEKDVSSVRANQLDSPAPVNREVLNVNAKVDDQSPQPITNAWARIVPRPVRDCLRRLFENARVIPRFTNALFQRKFEQAGGELARFGINSTIGVAGLFDPAEKWFGLQEHDNDFGQTLAMYGMSGGLYVTVPVAGPINVRDLVGGFVDGAMNPMNYMIPASAQLYELVAHSVEGLNDRSEDPVHFEPGTPPVAVAESR